MKKILKINEVVKVAQELRKQNKTIVLAGGFFDILHLGHIKFLEKAKQQGNFLFILLESDEKARQTKGKNRPIHSQKDRATVLASLRSVDSIVLLPTMTKNEEYDKLVTQIKPNIIATTYDDPYIIHKKRQAEQINSKVVEIIKKLPGQSTTRLAKLIKETNNK